LSRSERRGLSHLRSARSLLRCLPLTAPVKPVKNQPDDDEVNPYDDRASDASRTSCGAVGKPEGLKRKLLSRCRFKAPGGDVDGLRRLTGRGKKTPFDMRTLRWGRLVLPVGDIGLNPDLVTAAFGLDLHDPPESRGVEERLGMPERVVLETFCDR